jgi:hypothetical protein
VHSSSNALQLICQELQLTAAAQKALLLLPNEGLCAGRDNQSEAAAAAAAAVTSLDSEQQDHMEVDLTQDPPKDPAASAAAAAADATVKRRCSTVLLLPDHFTAADLARMLAPLPLWLLLAAPVVFFRQGWGEGVLQWLQQQQQQQQGGPASAGSQQQQQQQPPQQLYLPTALCMYQLFRNGVAIVVECSALRCSSKQQVARLLQLLHQAQQRQQQQRQGCVVMPSCWQLALSRADLQSLSPGRLVLLGEGLEAGR